MNGQTVLLAGYCVRCHAPVAGEALCSRCRTFFLRLATVSPAGDGGRAFLAAKQSQFAGSSFGHNRTLRAPEKA
jgi:hypothetical protein